MTAEPADRRWWVRCKAAMVFVIGAVGLTGDVVAIWGPIWPTVPEIRSTGSGDASPTLLPFSIRNSSVLFGTRISGWTCIIDEIRFGGPSAKNVMAGSGGAAMIPSADSVSYRCGLQVTGFHVSSMYLTVAVSYENILRKGVVKRQFQWVDAGQNSNGAAAPAR